MSLVLWGVEVDSDRSWASAGHFIAEKLTKLEPNTFEKAYWIKLFAAFRYLRYRYLTTVDFPDEERKKARLSTWMNLMVCLNSKENTSPTTENPVIPAYNDLPVFFPKLCQDYAANIVLTLVGDARRLKFGRGMSFAEDPPTEGILIFQDFRAELERDFEKMLYGHAPGPVAGLGGDWSIQALEFGDVEGEYKVTEECMRDIHNMMSDLGIEEPKVEPLPDFFARRNALSSKGLS